MRKIITLFLISISLTALAQKDSKPVKDSVVQITLTRDQFAVLLSTIDQNIDSKKTSKDVINFLISNGALVPKKEEKK
jgi:hypothetical protein